MLDGSRPSAEPGAPQMRRLEPHPVTRPWSGGPGVIFSWETLIRGHRAVGVQETAEAAKHAVTELLHKCRTGEGIVQKASLAMMHRTDDPHQYDYGSVVGRARFDSGHVVWEHP